MGRVLEVFGYLVIVGALLVMVIAVGRVAPGYGGISGFVALIWGAPAIFSGVVIIVFGSMLTQLSAIRSLGERQLRVLEALERMQGKRGGHDGG